VMSRYLERSEDRGVWGACPHKTAYQGNRTEGRRTASALPVTCRTMLDVRPWDLCASLARGHDVPLIILVLGRSDLGGVNMRREGRNYCWSSARFISRGVRSVDILTSDESLACGVQERCCREK